jgi:hypothetical protein
MQINISKYIFQFLKANGTIQLNGIGKIELHRKPAIINDSGIEILPPQSYFEFSNYSEPDLAFIFWLSKMTSFSEIVCENSLQAYIERIKSILKEDNTFHIPLVGTISNQNGEITFKSDSWSPYYKYPSLALSQIPIQKAITKEPKAARSRLWLIPLFLAMIAVSFFGWKSYQSYQSGLTQNNNFSDPEKEGRINQAPVFDSMLTKDSIVESQPEASKDEQTKQELILPIDSSDSPKIEPTEENEITESENSTSDIRSSEEINTQSYQDDCVVVVGAFRQASNVDKMMKRLSEDGYSPWKSNHNGLVRVGAKTNCDPVNLNSLLNSCKSKYDSGSWVLE